MVAILSFAIFLILGLAIYRDYGLGWDEPNQRYIGKSYFNYVVYGDQSLFNVGDRYYGPFYETILYTLTNNPRSDQEYYARHLVQFLTFFAGTLIFFALVRKIWKKDWLAWFGWLVLILSPRIFADAFYNSKDIPFMIAFIGAVYTLIRFLDQPSWKNVLLHAVCSAILITIRIPGILILAMTAGFLLLEVVFTPGRLAQKTKTGLARLAGYLIVSAGFVVLFWPVLWHDPVSEFVTAFREMSVYPNIIEALYKGASIPLAPPPPGYIPTWIAITTPILYLAFFGIGLIWVGLRFLRKPVISYDVEKRNLLILLTWCFAPIAIVILMRSNLYDAWRHMFFVYPALLLIALQGLLGLSGWMNQFLRPKITQWVLAGLILVGLIDPVSFMIRNHPYQNVYFNRLAGASMVEVKTQFEMDYWALSSKAALDYILRNDGDQIILISGDGPTAKYNSLLLSDAQRIRLIFTEDVDHARYFIGSYRDRPGNYPYPNEVFSVRVDGAKITSVFKLR